MAVKSELLSLVFTDLVDSTALKSRLGDAAAGERIARYQEQVRRRGPVEWREGDGEPRRGGGDHGGEVCLRSQSGWAGCLQARQTAERGCAADHGEAWRP